MSSLNIREKEVDIDSACVPLVKYFNDIGLDTKYCCEGHKTGDNFQIMFEDYVTDEQIVNFLSQYSNKYDHTPFCGKFMKWCRKMSGSIVFNWIYVAEKKEYATIDMERMKFY